MPFLQHFLRSDLFVFYIVEFFPVIADLIYPLYPFRCHMYHSQCTVLQVSTVSQALEMSRAARKASLAVIVGYSESGPESLDTFIADLSVGVGAGQLMAGGLLTGTLSPFYPVLTSFTSVWAWNCVFCIVQFAPLLYFVMCYFIFFISRGILLQVCPSVRNIKGRQLHSIHRQKVPMLVDITKVTDYFLCTS